MTFGGGSGTLKTVKMDEMANFVQINFKTAADLFATVRRVTYAISQEMMWKQRV